MHSILDERVSISGGGHHMIGAVHEKIDGNTFCSCSFIVEMSFGHSWTIIQPEIFTFSIQKWIAFASKWNFKPKQSTWKHLSERAVQFFFSHTIKSVFNDHWHAMHPDYLLSYTLTISSFVVRDDRHWNQGCKNKNKTLAQPSAFCSHPQWQNCPCN